MGQVRKRVSAEAPYGDYYLYVVWHKSEGRRFAVLVSKTNGRVRTTISYARYLMAVKLGRKLEKQEQVDHIDNDKTNDVIDNLQILTSKENLRKEAQRRGVSYVVFKCPTCGRIFEKKKCNTFLGKGSGHCSFCSRECAKVFIPRWSNIVRNHYVDKAIQENIVYEYKKH